MIAIIRTREKGRSQFLCELDIMQFTENQVRNRMIEKGIKDDAFLFVVFLIGMLIGLCHLQKSIF